VEQQRSRTSGIKVPMGNLRAEYESLRPAIDDAIRRVLDRGQFVFGEELDAFEEEFARYLGVRFAIGVGSGSAALHLALTACGLAHGDEVITVPNTDTPTTMAVTHAGGSIVWIDTDDRTFNLDPAALEEKITSRTKVILPVHLFGHPANMGPIMEVARRHNLVVVEDAALALGSEYNGQKVGSIGHIGCFSLAPSKILGAFGDAGIMVTDDHDIAERVRVLRNYGHAPDMKVDERDPLGPLVWRVLDEGYNERLDTLQAAILRAKLPTLNDRITQRRHAARRYNELLAESTVVLPHEASYAKHVYFAYAVLTDQRDEAREFLAARGVATRLYYNPPLHLQPAYRRFDLGPGSFPVAESTAARMLALPVFPEITDDQINLAASALAEFAGSRVGTSASNGP
jgi:dTDP-4-amino-4,6-dideoxygalactose transaminase